MQVIGGVYVSVRKNFPVWVTGPFKPRVDFVELTINARPCMKLCPESRHKSFTASPRHLSNSSWCLWWQFSLRRSLTRLEGYHPLIQQRNDLQRHCHKLEISIEQLCSLCQCDKSDFLLLLPIDLRVGILNNNSRQCAHSCQVSSCCIYWHTTPFLATGYWSQGGLVHPCWSLSVSIQFKRFMKYCTVWNHCFEDALCETETISLSTIFSMVTRPQPAKQKICETKNFTYSLFCETPKIIVKRRPYFQNHDQNSEYVKPAFHTAASQDPPSFHVLRCFYKRSTTWNENFTQRFLCVSYVRLI